MTEYDLFSYRFKADPFSTFARMRQDAPIYRHDAPNGLTIWYVTRYDEVVEVLKDNDHFCKNLQNALPPNESAHVFTAGRNVLQLINQNMLFADPPDHTRLRGLISQAFTPRRVAAMAGKIKDTANELLDAVWEQGEMELLEAYALPLPFAVITDLLGIPRRDRERVKRYSQAIIAPGSRGISVGERKRRIRAFVEYISALFQRRRDIPEDDLLTALVEAEEAGDRLSEEELSSMVMLLLVTGYETTVNLIGNGVYTLLRHPEAMALLREMPALMPQAIEEMLRYEGPVETSTTRWARKDFTLRGQQICRGDLVRVVISSANRDPAQFEQPDRFDIHREENAHLAFGLGIHYCLGAPLARLEGEIALNLLLERCQDLRLAVPASELQWRSGVLFHGLKKLPVRW